MKPDSERKKYHTEKLHERKKRLHVHLSKELRSKLKAKKRAILVHRDDQVRVMRGPGMGKEGRVTRVDTNGRKVYVDGVTATTAKGREVTVALQPSNLLLLSLEPTEERKKLFAAEAFRKPKEEKKAPKAAEPPKEAQVAGHTAVKAVNPTAQHAPHAAHAKAERTIIQ